MKGLGVWPEVGGSGGLRRRDRRRDSSSSSRRNVSSSCRSSSCRRTRSSSRVSLVERSYAWASGLGARGCVSRYYPNGITGKDNKEIGSAAGFAVGLSFLIP